MNQQMTLDDLIERLNELSLRGTAGPVTFEDDNGQPLRFVDAYWYGDGERFVIHVSAEEPSP